MQTMKKRSAMLVAVGGIGAAGVLGLTLAVNPAQAQDPSPSASASAGDPDRAAQRAQRHDELAAALATELGIDKAKVAAALEKVHTARQTTAKTDRIADLKTRLDAAVAAGTITAEESAAILKAAEAGVLPHGGGHRGGMRGFGR